MNYQHVPVLLDRCLELLAPALEIPGATLLDGTLGLGGHTESALARYPNLQVIGVDRDQQAIATATRRLSKFGDRFRAVHARYDQIPEVLAGVGIASVTGILLDLGISSMQVDNPERGFAYSRDVPLDMRMDQAAEFTAADLLASWTEAELRQALRSWGEEPHAARIAGEIVRQRAQGPITTSQQLVEIVWRALPAAVKHRSGNPAKRTFQALRIAVNQELDSLRNALPNALNALSVGGRLVVMSYHSLEDRLVKQSFQAGLEVSVPASVPIVPREAQPFLRALTRGAEKASAAEVATNPRSKSVRLRAVEKLWQKEVFA